MRRATEKIRSEMAMRMIATFRSRMFSRTWLGTKSVEILSPMVEKKLGMCNGPPPFDGMRDCCGSDPGIGIIE